MRRTRRTPWRFIGRISLEQMLISTGVFMVIQLFWDLGGRTRFDEMSGARILVLACLVAPIAETLVLQGFPVMLGRICGAGFWTQVAWSFVPFAALHFNESVPAGLSGGIVGGFYLAFTYVHGRKDSFWKAFGITAAIHALGNLITASIALSARAMM